MSILIKGMEMPKDEPLLVKINPDGTVSTTASNNYKKYEAVEFHPHGRLIDADALIARIRRAKELQPELSDLYENEALEMLLWVGTEPTIIEAENPFFESLKRGLEQAINGDVREQTISDAEETE